MTTITNTTSGRKLDASLDATLNPVRLGSNESSLGASPFLGPL
jgi:hypothetical protein